jgi:4-hydroxy-tetrahydrodipicolinate synthase
MAALFTGVGVALVTVFTPSGEVDPAATGKLAADLAGRGIRAVLVCGTTGEAATLTAAERTALIEAVRAAVPAEVPVIAGTGAPSTAQAAELTRAAVAAGADAVLAWCPAGTGPAAERAALTAFFPAIADAAAGRPVLAYHIPFFTSAGIPVDLLADLPVTGQKDSSGSPDRLLDELAHYSGDTYVGSAALLALAGPMGAAGALLALANVAPEGCVRAFTGEAAAQHSLAAQHLMVRGGGIPALKRMLAAASGLPATSRVW